MVWKRSPTSQSRPRTLEPQGIGGRIQTLLSIVVLMPAPILLLLVTKSVSILMEVMVERRTAAHLTLWKQKPLSHEDTLSSQRDLSIKGASAAGALFKQRQCGSASTQQLDLTCHNQLLCTMHGYGNHVCLHPLPRQRQVSVFSGHKYYFAHTQEA